MKTRTISPAALERELVVRLAGLKGEREVRRQASTARYRRQAHARRGSRRRMAGLAGLLSIVAIGAQAAWADGGTVDLQVATRAGYDVGKTTDGAIVEYIGDQNTSFGSAGTGNFGTFVQIQDKPHEEGYNTDGVSQFDTGSSPTFNHSILVSAIPTVPCESLDGNQTSGGLCWELFADINDSNAQDPSAARIQLEDVEVWFTTNKNITGYVQGGGGFAGLDPVYDFEGNILINDVNQGSGRGDLRYLIPIDGIDIPANCGYGSQTCVTYFVLYTEWGDTSASGDFISDSGFEEWKVKTYPFVSVTKTAEASFTRTFEWTIDKSVDPATWDLFKGDSGTSEYTVDVTKDEGTDSDFAVSGTITISNPGKLDAIIESAADITDDLSDGTPVDVDCGSTTFPVTLEKDDTLVCTYSAEPSDASADENTASVTLAEGTIFSGTADVDWGDPTTVVNGSINVTDSVEGDLGEFTDDHSVSYETTFACDADEGKHDNTATIEETDQSASASVTVNCYDLDVTKDADEGLTRTYQWDIDKTSSDPTELTLNPGETYDYPYAVTVSVLGSTDSAWGVSGDIHVKNPAPMSAVINDVTDLVSPDIAADVDCAVTFPYTLAAGATLDCTYTADVPDDADRTNTATAELQNHDYDSEGAGTESGTRDFTGTANVDFDGATLEEVDECIDVTDTLQGSLGTVCVADAPKTFSYKRTITATEEDCAGITITNTASFETNDTGADGSDDHTVVVTVPCDTGCTLTQGYWKTHSDHGPAKKSDPTWDLLANGPDTTFFLSGQTWYQVFWTAPKKGNAYYQLAHQYMAAKLNIMAGASSTASVDAAITWAETFFNTYTPSNWPKGSKTTIVQNAGVLGSYNEGAIGPGHCDEDTSARRANI